MQTIIDKLNSRRHLTKTEIQVIMTDIMSGKLTDLQIQGFLEALNKKGPTVEEIVGAAQIMRRFVLPVEVDHDVVLDTCGTGGDGKGTFNISTVSALVVAACGVMVAKHGNRSVSSACGSADVLEKLGVKIVLPHERVTACLKEVGIAFLFAQSHHPAMKHVAAARKAMKVKTIFNILGPLTNPARATHQMMGVYSKAFVTEIAHVLGRLGSKRAVVVHGADGLDEITLTDSTQISEFKEGDVVSYDVAPEKFGFAVAAPQDLNGGDVEENARIATAILSGEKGAKRDVVVLNAGFALYAAEKIVTPEEGMALAADALDSGAALKKLEDLKTFTNGE